jgi:hypothetical protein
MRARFEQSIVGGAPMAPRTRTRWVGVAAAALATAACDGRTVDLGGTASSCIDAASPPESCTYAGPYNDGSGYFGGIPYECADPGGTPQSPSSTDDVASALVGTWTGCAQTGPAAQTGPYAGVMSAGVEFTRDGRFSLLGVDLAWNMQPIADPAHTGTFAVVDASATLGPGAYQVRFTADNGGVSLSQIVLVSSPTKLRFFTPQATDFAPARTWQFRAGICGPAFDPESTCGSDANLLSRMAGRWIWCSGQPGPPLLEPDPWPQPGSPYVGLEIGADSSWVALAVDTDGGLVPAPLTMFSSISGTVELGGSQTLWTSQNQTYVFPEPPRVDACGRVMMPFGPDRVCDCSTPTSTTCQVSPCPIDYQESLQMVREP